MIEAEATFAFPVKGQRALIAFRPKNTSFEVLCAGVVIKDDRGVVHYRTAFDERKMRHAFSEAGRALSDIAEVLCASAASHWMTQELETWKAPFPGASVQAISRFSAMTVSSALEHVVSASSSFGILLDHYNPRANSTSNILQRVAAHWRQHRSRTTLTRFMERSVDFGEAHGRLKIDFWGERYSCYFTKLSDSSKNSAVLVERAVGRLVQLRTLREMSRAPQQTIGLFEELRPSTHELIVVGAPHAPKSLWQTERFADKQEIQIRKAASAEEAAEIVGDKELLAA